MGVGTIQEETAAARRVVVTETDLYDAIEAEFVKCADSLVDLTYHPQGFESAEWHKDAAKFFERVLEKAKDNANNFAERQSA